MWNKLNKSMMFCQMMFGLSFYGVMVILTRFFLEDLNYSEADTMMVVGAFSSIGPLFAIAGGFIADKFLGAYRSLAISYLTFAVGYGLLVLGASSTNVPLSLVGIALASYARGLMSPSYPSLYKRTFASEEDFNNGYPVNYSVNKCRGSLLGQYLFPMLVLLLGFHGSFALSALMATLATLTIVTMRRPLIHVASDKDQQPVSLSNWIAFGVLSLAMVGLVFFMFSNMAIGQNIVYAIGLAAIMYFISLMFKVSHAEALKMGTILIVTVLTTCFFVYYGQMMTSMTMVTINTMRGDLFGIIPIAPEASMAMNPLWCIVAGPAISYLFSTLEKRGITFSTTTKIAFAFVLTAISFGISDVLPFSTVGEEAIIRPEIFLVIHFFQAFAEVVVGSLVVAFILSVAPKQIENFSVSLFYIAMALSGIIGAVFSTSIALEKGQVVTQQIVQIIYGDYFKLLTMLAVVMVGVALLASVLVRKMLAAANQNSPSA
ncbi:DeoR faimly transcriptional regulator [Vibrio metoecus]|uniref:DeoR faimly transcriptional regulator n=1 Tax=Vibrio metoecus TaxID=1481663 RepID=A0A0Q0KJE8_VIBMT|nr:DeoR faimly transcriptional regulator [Vibrio metoecus]